VIRTPLTDLLGIRPPIVQAAMGYVSGPRLAAGTSNAGGLGLIASATMSLAELRAAIAETAGRTTAPFGVNLRADAPDAADRVKLIIAGRVPVASFAQAPKPELIAALKDAGVIVPGAPADRPAERVGVRRAHRGGDRDHGHVLHTARDDQVGGPAEHRLGGEVRRLLRRAALPVHGNAGHRLGQAGREPGRAGDVARLRADRVHAAEHHVVDG
jgi:nitronate monooxygenase